MGLGTTNHSNGTNGTPYSLGSHSDRATSAISVRMHLSSTIGDLEDRASVFMMEKQPPTLDLLERSQALHFLPPKL
jgi:hypothetical protein